jgi:hypothetical protein
VSEPDDASLEAFVRAIRAATAAPDIEAVDLVLACHGLKAAIKFTERQEATRRNRDRVRRYPEPSQPAIRVRPLLLRCVACTRSAQRWFSHWRANLGEVDEALALLKPLLELPEWLDPLSELSLFPRPHY